MVPCTAWSELGQELQNFLALDLISKTSRPERIGSPGPRIIRLRCVDPWSLMSSKVIPGSGIHDSAFDPRHETSYSTMDSESSLCSTISSPTD